MFTITTSTVFNIYRINIVVYRIELAFDTVIVKDIMHRDIGRLHN